MTDVTLVPLIIAAVAYIAVGYGWYHPRIFGDAWMRMSNISPEAIEAGKKRMPLTLIVALIAGIVVGYVPKNSSLVVNTTAKNNFLKKICEKGS
jgi:hypothetical protein